MMWLLFLGLASAAFSASAVAPQPCSFDFQCFEGYFCDTTSQDSKCLKCLSCQKLKREPPLLPTACIKSGSHCGPCLKGLVPDPNDEMSCVLPTDTPSSNNTLFWVLGAILLLVVIVVAVTVLYRISKTKLFKFRTDADIGATLPYRNPTAPEAPPPYDSRNGQPATYEDTSRPLMKPPLTEDVAAPRFELSDRQIAGIFNPPAYVRYNNPPSDDNGNNDDAYYATFEQDEETQESLWTPGEPTNNNTIAVSPGGEMSVVVPAGGSSGGAAPTDFSAALAVARSTDLVHPPHRLRTPNCNGNSDSMSGDESGEPSRLRNDVFVGVNVQIRQSSLLK